jgi:cytochrome P450 family 110
MAENNKLLNGPPNTFLQNIKTTLDWTFRPYEFLDDCSQRYGDPIRFGGEKFTSAVYFSHPKALEQIFTADPATFTIGAANRSLQPLLGLNSLILLDGDRHQHQRKLVAPPFHGENMQASGLLICDVTKQVINQLKVGEPFRVRQCMQDISLQVILRNIFGLHEGEQPQRLKQLIISVLDSVGSTFGSSQLLIPSLQKNWGKWSPWGRFLLEKQQLDELLNAEIQQRRSAKTKPDNTEYHSIYNDILSQMISAHDEAGQPMSDAEIHDEIITLLFGGHETTASALTWALYWIHYYPDIREKLFKELNTLPPEPNPKDIIRLPYLEAVCQETLRIYPIIPIGFGRFLNAPLEVMGYRFEKGSALFPAIYLTHRREEIYPEPTKFRPERFLERRFSPYEYLPFGGGSRRCIGAAFAPFELKLVLATILREYSLSLTDLRPVKPKRRGISVAPPSNLQMVVTK